MSFKNFIWAVLLFVGSIAFAQPALNDIPDDLGEYYRLRKAAAIEYAIAHNLPIRQEFADGTIMEIQYLDESGKPLYYKTFNAEASFTTGTDKLYAGSDLGLALSGLGIKVGIWDAGLPRATHIEFENRVQIVEGSNVSGHATHVTGTVLAKGINPAAKGMAFEATSVNYDGLNGDASEMKSEAQNGLLLSNHSYGSVLGWNFDSSNNSWQWFGDISISNQEDYRFGYYSSTSANWDNIAFDNPYYLIVKSAGNDRTDVGDGNGPPPDGPYDIVGPKGIAKNILTVGSANRLTAAYTSPADVTLAPYSSWGPTDDGRIKPDIIGMGQNVLSTSADGDDQYNVLSGTSMSSPNVAGSLALLQQQYYQQKHEYLTAAALKSLVIHTAYETGISDGPDYQFGWGLLNMAGASKMLMLNGQPGYIIKQDSLLQGATNTIPVAATANQKLTVTIVWTDPAGEAETVPAVDPPALKLVNDLDIRVTDESGSTIFLPWKMDPVNKQASRGDNFRDNVEKIELIAPTTGTYTVSIAHKDSLFGGRQDYAIIISPEDLGNKLKPFYFVGSSLNFLDQANWSDESGGVPINQVPGADDIIIFDNNSQGSLAQAKISLPANFSCFSMAASDSAAFELDLNGNTLSLGSNLIITNKNFLISNGLVNLAGRNVSSTIQVKTGSLQAANVLISNNTASLNLLSAIDVDTLMIRNSNFNSNSYAINASAISIDNSTVDWGNSQLAKLNKFSVIGATATVLADNARLIFDGAGTNKIFSGGKSNYGVIKVVSGDLSISQLNLADSVIVESRLIFLDSAVVQTAKIIGPSSLLIGDGQELNIEKSLILNSSAGSRIEISNYNTGTGLAASIRSEINPKLCFDYVDVANIEANGNTKFVVGSNSTLTNTNGWLQGVCQDILAADFMYEFTCTGGLTSFTDMSDGSPDSWRWDFGDSTAISTEQNPTHSFLDTGRYVVRLTVGLGLDSSIYSAAIQIDLPTIGEPAIVLENNQLRSTSFADNYQWFFNAQPIPGETNYYLDNFSNAGTYHIEIWNNQCRLASEAFVVTGIESSIKYLRVFPNPFTDRVIIRSEKPGRMLVSIRDLTGKVIFERNLNEGLAEYQIDTSEFDNGLYFIDLAQGEDRGVYRMIKLR
jgi:Subtilase family/PKD domain/Secretion system C-terminal sorting domain